MASGSGGERGISGLRIVSNSQMKSIKEKENKMIQSEKKSISRD
jgi:hypothetical protein